MTFQICPAFTYRHRWQVNDVEIWDNRCILHLSLKDFDQTSPRPWSA